MTRVTNVTATYSCMISAKLSYAGSSNEPVHVKKDIYLDCED